MQYSKQWKREFKNLLTVMAISKSLTTFSLILVTVHALPFEGNISTTDTTGKETINYRLPGDIIPRHYNIKLIPHIVENNFTFDGEVSVHIEIQNPIHDVKLHSYELWIDKANRRIERKDGATFIPTSDAYDNVTQILTIHFKDTLLPGYYTLHLRFRGILNNELYGFYRTSYIDDQNNTIWLATTQFEVTSARRAFPCWDEPALKASFNISIKHYDNYTALSNMPVISRSPIDENDGKLWTHFEQSPMMSTYLVAFVVSDFVNFSNADGTVNVWCRKNAIQYAKFFNDVAIRAAAELERYTNSTARVPKMDHVVVPQHPSGAMENWGIITYPERVFIYDEEHHATSRKQNAVLTIVHELTHQWFGNVVSAAWWSYIWLSEGFASYFESYITDQLYEDWRQKDLFVPETTQMILSIDSIKKQPITVDVNLPEEIWSRFSTITYRKTAAVLHMLSHAITADVFRTGLIKYLDTHEYKSTTSNDLWETLQQALDSSDIRYENFTIKDAMDTWLMQEGFPMVTVERDYATGEAKLTQEVFRKKKDKGTNDDAMKNKWWIPITYATQGEPNFSETVPKYWLQPGENNTTIEGIDENDWIIVNLQETGLYRVNYDTANWIKIANYLQSENYTRIHVLNRAQILDDSYNLMREERLSPETFMKIASYLSRESDYIPWRTAFQMFSDWEYTIQHPAANTFLKPFLLNLMQSIFEAVGFEERLNESDFTKVMRRDVLYWLCVLDHAETKNNATATLITYIQDPENVKISPNIKEWIFCCGLRDANETVWNATYDVIDREGWTDLLEYVGCANNPNIIDNYLNGLLLKESSSVRNKTNFFQAYRSLSFNNHQNLNTALDFVIRNARQLSSCDLNPMRLIDYTCHYVQSREQLDKIKGFNRANEIKDNKNIHTAEKRIAEFAKTFSELNKLLET